MELGVYFGLLIVWGLSMDTPMVVFLLAVAAARKIISHRHKHDEDKCPDHSMGFHDAVHEPHYFGATAVVIVFAYYLIQFL